jgi:hypothetical protein
MRRSRILWAAGILIAVVLSAGTVRADQYVGLPWKVLAGRGDFMGIVECTVAGGIVADYRVVETWKGAPQPGDPIRLRLEAGYWMPQYPTALVGQRLLVIANRVPVNPPFATHMTLDRPCPLFARDIPFEYFIPSHHTSTLLSLREDEALHRFASPHTSVDEFRNAVNSLLSGDTPLELAMVRAMARMHLLGKEEDNEAADTSALESELNAATDLAELLAALRTFALIASPLQSSSIQMTLAEGGARMRALLEAEDALTWPERVKPKSVISIIDNHENWRRNGPSPEDMRPRAPSLQGLDDVEATLDEGPKEIYQFNQAFAALTRYKPHLVAKWLKDWNEEEAWRAPSYNLASYFAFNCPSDRAKHFRTMTRAKKPMVRVAGAVYLTFENEAKGLAKLHKLVDLPGDAGYWAAHTLARRGDTSVVPRILEGMGGSYEHGMAGAMHRNLLLRSQVLFSNAAANAGVPQPNPPRFDPEDKTYPARLQQHYQEWWDAHGAQLTLHDPWLPALIEQEVD